MKGSAPLLKKRTKLNNFYWNESSCNLRSPKNIIAVSRGPERFLVLCAELHYLNKNNGKNYRMVYILKKRAAENPLPAF